MFNKSDTRSREELHERQLKQLKRQLQYCRDNIPYYRRLFSELNFGPEKLNDLVQLERLPILSKSIVRGSRNSFCNERLPKYRVHTSFSSGSTGEPFATHFDSFSWYLKKYLVKLRARFSCGMKVGQRVAILECESEEVIAKRNKTARIYRFLLNVRVFSLFSDKEKLIQSLREFRPQNIYAYPSHLLELSDFSCSDHPVIPGVESLFTSSEFLENGMRASIEQRFGARIFDTYGSTEFKEIAWQCRERNWYHLNNDHIVCEVVDATGRAILGEPGHIVVTDLKNKAMPLVRFDLGDHGVLTNTACSCGYRGNSIKPLGGRSSDYLQLQDGRQLSPFRFTTEIEHLSGLLQYQIVQHSSSVLEVKTRWKSAPTEEKLKLVKNMMIDVLVGAEPRQAGVQTIQIDVSVCDTIAIEENGKFKVVKRLF